jgi:hypothetical protein
MPTETKDPNICIRCELRPKAPRYYVCAECVAQFQHIKPLPKGVSNRRLPWEIKPLGDVVARIQRKQKT